VAAICIVGAVQNLVDPDSYGLATNVDGKLVDEPLDCLDTLESG